MRHVSFPTQRVEQGWYADLIAQLVARRCLLKLSQRAVADTLGIENKQLSNFERLVYLPSPFLLMCWCQGLGLTLTVTEVEPARGSWLQPMPDAGDARRIWGP